MDAGDVGENVLSKISNAGALISSTHPEREAHRQRLERYRKEKDPMWRFFDGGEIAYRGQLLGGLLNFLRNEYPGGDEDSLTIPKSHWTFLEDLILAPKDEFRIILQDCLWFFALYLSVPTRNWVNGRYDDPKDPWRELFLGFVLGENCEEFLDGRNYPPDAKTFVRKMRTEYFVTVGLPVPPPGSMLSRAY